MEPLSPFIPQPVGRIMETATRLGAQVKQLRAALVAHIMPDGCVRDCPHRRTLNGPHNARCRDTTAALRNSVTF